MRKCLQIAPLAEDVYPEHIKNSKNSRAGEPPDEEMGKRYGHTSRRHVKRCSMSLVIREMANQKFGGIPLHPGLLGRLEGLLTPSADQDVQQQKPLSTDCRNAKWRTTLENSFAVSLKVKHVLTI